ncbi:hypothetical protein [Candidatus Aalborgicola defluviihabitans]|uniref:hypothetical protein n=1 Tax=Candidatus Aalborgicola defluviihabitans TaxID=3386187 RepID=UPI00390B9B66|nr:hypothetical protein [Burkholderiales bacterium]
MQRLYPTKACVVLGAWLLSAAAVCSATEVPAPPVAPIHEVIETLHGVTLTDPYRYLENLRAPDVQEWFKGQGAYARATLDRIAGRDAMEKRITELTSASGDAITRITRMPGDRIYYLKRAKGERQFKLAMRVGTRGAEHILMDPEVEAKRTGVPHAINYYRPSWDGKYVAYGVSAGGSEDASLHILDVESGHDIAAVFERVHQPDVNWLPDSRSLAFNQLKVPTPGEPESEAYGQPRDAAYRGRSGGQGRGRFRPHGDAQPGSGPFGCGFAAVCAG